MIKKLLFYFGIIWGILCAALFLPQRWKTDLRNLSFSISNGEGYVFLQSPKDEIPKGSYVILTDPYAFDETLLADELDEKEAFLGIIELRPGWGKALRIANLRQEKERIFRVHMLKEGEYEKLRLNEESLYLRLRRAVIERSIDLIILKNIPTSVASSVEARVKKDLSRFVLDKPSPAFPPSFPLFLPFLAMFLILSGLSPLLGIISLIIYVFSIDFGVSFAAILSTIAIYKYTRNKPWVSFFSFLLLGILTSLSLSNFYHLNQLHLFRGVKISLLLLPLLVLIKGAAENRKTFQDKKFLMITGTLLAVLLVYYIMRSGNYGLVLNAERRFRDFLDSILLVRPRFKEVFGYVFLFLAAKRKSKYSFIYEFFGAIALASTFNTFCHIKAPVFISIYRSFLGVAFGFIIYLIPLLKR